MRKAIFTGLSPSGKAQDFDSCRYTLYVGSNPTSPVPHTVDVDFDNEEQAGYTAVRDATVCEYKGGYMNNKKWGTQWEKDFCKLLAGQGFWVHFLSPDNHGAQPFDVIAVKAGEAYCYDCKTCADNWFSIDRLEDNQVMAFEKWIRCGNTNPNIAVLHNDKLYLISYEHLKAFGRVRLNDDGSTSVRRNKL